MVPDFTRIGATIMFALALTELGADRLSRLIMQLLAVGGGFLAGFAIAWLLGMAIDKWVTGRESPFFMHKVARMLGGLIGAIIVAMIVFGDGNGGGGGRGDGEGSGKLPAKNGGAETPDTSTVPTTVVLPKDVPPVSELVKVTILGGEEVPKDSQRFYKLDGDAQPITLVELRERFQTRKQSTTKSLGLEIRLSDRTDPDGGAVRQLERWRKDEAISVTYPGSK